MSGKAILAREKQGDNATFHFTDNLARAIALTGRIIVSWIPHYYDTERIVGIVGPDDTQSTQPINQTKMAQDASGALVAIKENDLTSGEYSVTVEAGPSYATKRQESAESLMAFVQAYPPAAQFAGDLIAKSQDWADADVIAERLQMMLPQNIQQAIQAKEAGQDPQMAQMAQQMQGQQQQMQQMQQQAQAIMEQMQARIQELEQERANKQGENEAKIALEQIKAQSAELKSTVDLLKELIKLQQAQATPIGPEAMAMAPQASQAVNTIEAQA